MPGMYPPKKQVPTFKLEDFASQITALVTARVEAEKSRDEWRRAESKAREELKAMTVRALAAEAKVAGTAYNAPQRVYRIAEQRTRWLRRKRWIVESKPAFSHKGSMLEYLTVPSWEPYNARPPYRSYEEAVAALANTQR